MQTWWVDRRDELLKIESPTYVYDKKTISEQIDKLKRLDDVVYQKFYAIKANSNLEILKIIVHAGYGLECVSIDEVKFVLDHCAIKSQKVLFTPNFAPISEYQEAFELGVIVTVDNLFLLQKYPEIFKSQEIFVRIDPAFEGHGHSEKVQTSGVKAKFGIHLDDLAQLSEIAKHINCKIYGLHCHVGSGIFDPEIWGRNAKILSETASLFGHHCEFINIGGGLGVPYHPDDKPLDLDLVHKHIKEIGSKYKILMEPGRFIVAPSGVLLTRVTQMKEKTPAHVYIGVDAGMNALIRPTLYGSYHHIINLTRIHSNEFMNCDVVGPICETGDFLGKTRSLPKDTDVDDVILICTAGAYGFVMSSTYNMRKKPKEILI